MSSFFKSAFSLLSRPSRVKQRRIIRPESLVRDMRRIAGNLTIGAVSHAIREADRGEPYDLIDIANECRQKDAHLQAILSVREDAIGEFEWVVEPPKNATDEEVEAAEFAQEAIRGLQRESSAAPGSMSFTGLLEHLQSANYYGFANAEMVWGRKEGRLVPVGAFPISHRRFRFNQDNGMLVFKDQYSVLPERNLLSDFVPGKFIQHQPRVNGDIKSREGLARVLIWAALFRNWTLKDWLILAEMGWKPWLKASYSPDLSDEGIEDLRRALEMMSSSSILIHPDASEVDVIDQAKTGGGLGGMSSHRELYEFLGREMSKAVLGANDVVEAGETGSRAAVQERGKRVSEKVSTDAQRVSSTVQAQLIAPLISMNYGPDVRPGVFTINTQDVSDVRNLSVAIKNLVTVGVPLSATWVYDELGGGRPIDEDDEIVLPEYDPDNNYDPNHMIPEDSEDEENDQEESGESEEKPDTDE